MCDGDFSLQVIRRSINTTSENMSRVCEYEIINTIPTIDEDTTFFMWKPE